MRQLLFSLLVIATLPAYADGARLERVLRQTPEIGRFDFCQGGTCAQIDTVGLTDEEWAQVRDEFDPIAEDAATEREYIGHAVALLERIVGPKTGTDGDRAGTFGNSAYPGQLDCNDEAANTTTYLKLMFSEGLLHYHHPASTKIRGFFFKGWPHTTAVIQENDGDEAFAVDSWFFDNGEAPVIIPLEMWQSGWKPETSTAR